MNMKTNRFSRIALATIFLLITNIAFAQAQSVIYKEADFSKEELDLSALNEQQKEKTLKILNQQNCTCGCTKGSWANCIKNDSHCPFNRPMGASVAKMVKEGKSEDFIFGFFDGWLEGLQRKKKAAAEEDPNRIFPVTTMNAPLKGPQDAPVTIIEYLDYQCFFCKRAYDTINKLLLLYPDKIRLAAMNNPLEFHHRAFPAALAARAAEKQGKFWEMQALIFEDFGKVEEADLLNHANSLGLNIEQFNKDRNDNALKIEILKEQEQALKNTAPGTPAFFINGKKISGAQPLEVFKQAVDEAIAAKEKSK